MKADFHLHSSFSGDSQTPQEAVIAAGISQGLSALCFTDHMDADYPCTDVSFELDTENYLASVRELQQRYSGKLSIGAGVELGLQPHLGDYYRSYTRQYDFDFIIGSTHLVDRYDPYYPEFWNIYNKKEGVLRFLEITLENIQAFDSFDVYGHLDYIVRYVPGEDRSFPYADYADLTDEILRLLISTGKGIEINTAGYKAGLGVPNPCPDVLKRYRELGGEIITMGSDAHTAEYVGSCMEKAQELLRSCGFRYFTIFKNRKPEFLPL